jgi:hypothetical protein
MKRKTITGVAFCAVVLLMASCKKEAAIENIQASEATTARMQERKGVILYRGSGDIVPAKGRFLDAIGTTLNTTPIGEPEGYRMLEWAWFPLLPNAAPNFPGDFFNSTDPAAFDYRKRGIVFSTPGTALRVSDENFTDIDPSYATVFKPYTTSRSFSAIGSNIVDVRFKVPGTATNAYVHSFGVILIDTDNGSSTLLEYFSGNESLGVFMAPPGKQEGQAFVGVTFPDKRVTRVRITCGSGILAPGSKDMSDGGGKDLVVLDDMFYNEPKAL